MELQFSTEIFSADTESRTITGQIVPFGKPGKASIGETVFETGSLMPFEPSDIVLNMEHDATRPVGRMTDAKVNPSGIIGTFKIAETTAGNDLLAEAAAKLRTGLSIEAAIDNHDVVDGIVHIKAARLTGVAAVTRPAFGENAQITKVAASEEETTETPELETPVEEPTEGMDVMSETTATAVEATEVPVVQAAAPVYASAPKPSADDLTIAVVRAARGDHAAANTITAALDGATTSTAPGVVPVSYMRDVIDVIDSSRPFINSIRRAALPATGTSFKKPRWTSYPTVDVHSEGGNVATNDALIESITIDIASRMGGNKMSVELLDRSDPSYFAELRMKLADAYAINTETEAIASFVDNAQAATGATAYAALVDGIAKVYSGIKRRPNRLLVSIDAWADLMAVVDEAGRPLFAPLGAQNSVGGLSPFAGTILGLDVVVSHNAPEGTCVVYSDQSAVYYEAPGSPAVLQATVVSTAEVEVAVKGYDAISLDFEFTEGDPAVTTNYGAAAVSL